MEKQVFQFASRLEFEQHLQACLARAQLRLRLFDPDFALWGLGTLEGDAGLRRFLLNKGRLELVAHNNVFLERQCPRFLHLLKEFGHAIDCRVTNKNLRHLTDSFCIADDAHIVRRFHCDHVRGEAAFDSPADTMVSAERFAGIWAESNPGLHATTTGL